MSLFRKPKKNLRQRVADSDDEVGEADDLKNSTPLAVKSENAEKISSSASGPKAKTKSTPTIDIKKKSSTLSFQEELEGDDGVEMFQIKKSSQSRRIAKRMEKERKLKEQEQTDVVTTTTKEEIVVTRNVPVSQQKDSSPETLILSGREAEMAGYRSGSEDDEAASDNEGRSGVRFRQPDPFRRVLESRARITLSST